MDQSDARKTLATIYAQVAVAEPVRRIPDADSATSKCHENASRHCTANRGTEVVTGWLILPFYGLTQVWLIPHSVVRCSDGELLDVTPQHDERKTLKFVPDASPLLLSAIVGNIGYFDFVPTDDEAVAAEGG